MPAINVKGKAMDIQETLRLHKLWLGRDGKGEKADLSGANLSGAGLREADLCEADLREAYLRWADLSRADLRWADLRGADLREADLRRADLRGANLSWADLRGANLDYSAWPLRCESFDVIVDERLVRQLVYHIARLDYRGEDQDIKTLLNSETFIEVANAFHHVRDYGEVGGNHAGNQRE